MASTPSPPPSRRSNTFLSKEISTTCPTYISRRALDRAGRITTRAHVPTELPVQTRTMTLSRNTISPTSRQDSSSARTSTAAHHHRPHDAPVSPPHRTLYFIVLDELAFDAFIGSIAIKVRFTRSSLMPPPGPLMPSTSSISSPPAKTQTKTMTHTLVCSQSTTSTCSRSPIYGPSSQPQSPTNTRLPTPLSTK